MKLTESRLRSIIQEELQKLTEKATLDKVANALEGSQVKSAELDHNRLTLDVGKTVRFNIEDVFSRTGRSIPPADLEAIFQGSVIEHASKTGRGNQLEFVLSNGYEFKIVLPSFDTNLYIR